jgi:hypothetical protein
MPHLTDSELENISKLFAAGNVGNAGKIDRLLSRERTEDATVGLMRRVLLGLLMSATIALTVVASTSSASAWRGGWGWGPGIAAGIVGGAIVTGAIMASRPPGYVVYPGYAQPVYGPGCYWASRPVYDPYGRIVSYSGQPVQVCPNYAPQAPPPGYAGSAPPPPPSK